MPAHSRALPGPLLVRRADRGDLPDIARIYLAAFPETVEQLHLGRIRLEAIAEMMRIPLGAEPEGFFVAEVEGRVAGYLICAARADRIWRGALWRGHALRLLWLWLTGRSGVGLRSAAQIAADKLHFWSSSRKSGIQCPARGLSLAVDPDFHRRGIGRRLLEEGLHYLRSKKVPCVRLEVRPANDPAKRLYESLGFRTADTIHDTRGPWEVMLLDWRPGRSSAA